jgi:hypothetical protein
LRIQQHIELRLWRPIFPQRGNIHVDCGVTRIDSIEIKFFESRKSDRQRRFYSAHLLVGEAHQKLIVLEEADLPRLIETYFKG